MTSTLPELRVCRGGCGRVIQPEKRRHENLIPGLPIHAAHGLCQMCYRIQRQPAPPPPPPPLPPAPPADWRDSAACRTADPHLFTADTTTPPRGAARAARDYCAQCPARTWCRAFADRNPECGGIYGGEWRVAVECPKPGDRSRRIPLLLEEAS